jgi:hypothetical protein
VSFFDLPPGKGRFSSALGDSHRAVVILGCFLLIGVTYSYVDFWWPYVLGRPAREHSRTRDVRWSLNTSFLFFIAKIVQI